MKSVLFTAVPLILLAGCSQTPLPQRVVEPATIISFDAAVTLSGMQPGQSAMLSATPWGDNVSVMLKQRYVAATGLPCVRLSLVQQQKTALACQTSDNLWLAEQAFVR